MLGFGLDEIASTVSRSEDACRQLAARFDAMRDGDADGGGTAPAWGPRVFGVDKLSRLLVSVLPQSLSPGMSLEQHRIDGQAGAIILDRDRRVVGTWALDVLDGRIQTIRAVLAPGTLGHVGPVADAWATQKEA